MTERDWDVRAGSLSAEAYAAGEPTAWFDRLYDEGDRGVVSMPWDRADVNPVLRVWCDGAGRPVLDRGGRAVVVGAGLGADAEHLAALGLAVTAFDVAPTAVRVARDRHPGTTVDYRVADLFDLPAELVGGFDVVVEVFTLQALPDPPRAAAVDGVLSLLAPGGTLVAVQFAAGPDDDPLAGPPFPQTEAAMRGVARGDVALESLDIHDGRWLAVYRREG